MIFYAVTEFDKIIIIEDEPLVFDDFDLAKEECAVRDKSCV